MLEAEPLRRRKLYEEISSRIEVAILAGHLAPGDSLPSERELMATYGVGRTAVREALFALQEKGLLKLQSGQRATVVQPSLDGLLDALSGQAAHVVSRPDRLKQLQDARALLEGFLARQAARQASPEQILHLKAMLDANGQSLDDPARFIATNLDFHYAIASVSGNLFIDGLHRIVYRWLQEQRQVSVQEPGARETAFTWHERIFEAIRDRDADAAEAAMLQHIGAASAAYWRIVV